MKPRYWNVELKPPEDDQQPILVAKIFVVETSHDAVDLDLARLDSLLVAYCNLNGLSLEMLKENREQALHDLVCLVANSAAATKGWAVNPELGFINEALSLQPRLLSEPPVIQDRGYRAWFDGV